VWTHRSRPEWKRVSTVFEKRGILAVSAEWLQMFRGWTGPPGTSRNPFVAHFDGKSDRQATLWLTNERQECGLVRACHDRYSLKLEYAPCSEFVDSGEFFRFDARKRPERGVLIEGKRPVIPCEMGPGRWLTGAV
jgi:hypothetical protein